MVYQMHFHEQIQQLLLCTDQPDLSIFHVSAKYISKQSDYHSYIFTFRLSNQIFKFI